MGTSHIPYFFDNGGGASHAELQLVLDECPLVAGGVQLGVLIQEVVLELHRSANDRDIIIALTESMNAPVGAVVLRTPVEVVDAGPVGEAGQLRQVLDVPLYQHLLGRMAGWVFANT